MPTGTPNYGFIPPYPIRVDTFHTPRDAPFSPPALYLLTHTHTDHTVGLAAKSFSSRIVCSPDAREMLLAMEPAKDRIAVDNGVKALRNRPYAHLKIDPVTREDGSVDYSRTRDLLLAVPLNTPRVFELSAKDSVTITLIDANHCLGAVMFLVEGEKGAVLHTGDFRAESSFLSSLRLNPLLQRYLAPAFCFTEKEDGPTRALNAIYLDTACMLQTHSVPAKTDATDGLVQLMALFPANTRFFLNCWTWGYEDILKAVASAFQTKIHVDRYKYTIFMKTSDPFLKALVSLDENVSRFHACERHDRCRQVNFPPKTESIVYINPVDMSVERWREYLTDTRARLEAREPLTNLIVPLARHSPLPELQTFVKMFRPKCVVPNTLDPALHGVDYAAMISMFEDCLAPGGASTMKDQMLSERISMGPASLSRRQKSDAIEPRDGVKIQLENLVGLPGIEEDAAHWVDSVGGRGRKFQALKSFLPESLHSALDRVMTVKKPPPAKVRDGSDYETTDDEQSYVASLDFQLTSSPLAGRSQEARVFEVSTPRKENIHPATPAPSLRKQRTLPDVSPTATPRTSQRSQDNENSLEKLVLQKPERACSEPELNALGTPYSSPARPLKRKLALVESSSASKAPRPSAQPPSKQREPFPSSVKLARHASPRLSPAAVSLEGLTTFRSALNPIAPARRERILEATGDEIESPRSTAPPPLRTRLFSSSVSTSIPLREELDRPEASRAEKSERGSATSGAKLVPRDPEARASDPGRSVVARSSTSHPPSKSEKMDAAASVSNLSSRRQRPVPRDEAPLKKRKVDHERQSLQVDRAGRKQVQEDGNRSGPAAASKPLIKRPSGNPRAASTRARTPEPESSGGESTSVVPDSQDSGISTVSAVLRRTRTVTHTEELVVPAQDPERERRRRLKEETRRMSEMLREARPDLAQAAAAKRHKTVGDVPTIDFKRKRLKTASSSDALQADGRAANCASAAPRADRARREGSSSSRSSERHERQVTPLTMHAAEPFGLEVTLPGVGFAFRDSQGAMPVEDFDYEY